MDQATTSVSSSRNCGETGMEHVLSDLKALKRLYGLLHNENLDETSRTLLMKLLDDATQQALLKQAKMLSGSLMSPALERKLSIRSDRRTRVAEPTTSVSSSRNSETGMEQVLSDLKALKRLYGLLHKGPADENLDETSRALLMKMLDDAAQQALLKQAKMLSGSLMSPALERKLSIRSDRRTRDADPPLSLRPPASPSPSLLTGERSSRLNMQNSTVSSRPGGHVDGNRLKAEEPLLARLASYRSSKTAASALPPRHRPSGEQQRNSGLSLYRLSVAATSQHGTVAGSNRHADQRDRMRRTCARGDQSSLEGSSRRRFVSREMSLGRARLHGRGTDRRVGAESSSSTRRFGRLDSGLSLSKVSRRGSERAGRGVATPEQSSSSKTVATILSRIMPNQNLKERCLRRAEEEESTQRRGRTDASVSSGGSSSSSRLPRRTTLKRVDSGSMYISRSSRSSGAAISYLSTSPSVMPESSASASYSPSPVTQRGIAWPYSPSPVLRRGIAWPVYAPQALASRSLRRRRRQEILQRRVERLRMLKNKIAMVFHHHYHYGHGQEGPSSSGIPREHHRKSPWRYLEGMLHRTKGQDKKTTSRAVVGAPEKKRGGGNLHVLFDAMRRHLRGKRRTPASVKMRKMANRSRVQAKKMNWWQRLRQQRGGRTKVMAGGRPRRRLGHGKAV